MGSAYSTPRRRTPRYERLVNGKAVTASGGQRHCSHPECTTMLSRYNPDETCNLHGGWTDESVPKRGRKPRATGEDADADEEPGARLAPVAAPGSRRAAAVPAA